MKTKFLIILTMFCGIVGFHPYGANAQTLSLSNCTTQSGCMTNPCQAIGSVCPFGGTQPYTYLWMPGGQTTQSATGLCPGNYTVTVTDATSTTALATVTISQANILTVSCSANPSTINSGNSATISATPSGGTPGYSYSWSTFSNTNPIVVSPTTTSCYSVTVTDANGCTDTSSICITVNPTGINEYVNNISFTISPNPTSSVLSIQLGNGQYVVGIEYKIEIYNMLGEKVYSSQINSYKTEIDLSNQPKGIYFLKIQSEDEIYTGKVVVQ